MATVQAWLKEDAGVSCTDPRAVELLQDTWTGIGPVEAGAKRCLVVEDSAWCSASLKIQQEWLSGHKVNNPAPNWIYIIYIYIYLCILTPMGPLRTFVF